MKKIVYLTLMGCLAITIGLFSFTPLTSAAAPVSYTLYIDGKVSSAKFPTVVENNTTLIPMKSVLSELGYTTTVDSKTKSITSKNSNGSYVTVKTGSKKAKINGSEVLLPASVKAMNGTTYIPLSVIRNLTGKAIGIDASQRIAWIGEKPTDTAPVPTWGLSPDQVKSASGQDLLIDEGGEGDIYLLLYQSQTNDTEEVYIFYKNKLAKIAFNPNISGLDETVLLGVYSGIYDEFTKSYGEPYEGSMALNKNTVDKYLTLFANQGYFISEWQAGGTKITLFLKTTDSGYIISMQYVDASLETKVNAAMDAIKQNN